MSDFNFGNWSVLNGKQTSFTEKAELFNKAHSETKL